MRAHTLRRRHDERGTTAAAEMVLLTPLSVVVLGFLVAAGRLAGVSAEVTAASRDAARAASLARSWPEAVAAAEAGAASTLAHREVTCRDLRVTMGERARFVPGGEVSVTVTCTVVLADAAVPGLPGRRPVTATAVEVLDRFRWLEPA